MSRIGNQPVQVPAGVTVDEAAGRLTIKGSKGELTLHMPKKIKLTREGDSIVLTREGSSRFTRGAHGSLRATLANALTGVTKGWTKQLELSGVGYRAAVSGSDLVLSVGFSHQVTIKPPVGITFTINEGKIVVSGNDRHIVGQVAADIRSVKPPEPYKGKGIKYVGERIRKKAGKAKAVGGAPGATK